ncbi:guanylate kinase [Krasilnikovia cinnamomea]|uniref:Guanylate kinase n=1 Tax=Krasilnikovia cinnamomea TaxID=349313 RepID=A0A4Q7ZPR2_9ACTN|nr:guanylate kinase [Krasilnikovia cinnamomea]
MRGVILYGPPASGKDTVTKALHKIDPSYQLFPRIKIGSGRTTGYRMVSGEVADALRARGDIVWENARYSSRYLIDRPHLLAHLGQFYTVVHLGQVPAVAEVVRATPDATWHVVFLWCPRDVAATRIRARATGDDSARLAAWDATEPLPDADLFLDTSLVSAEDAARQIMSFPRNAR